MTVDIEEGMTSMTERTVSASPAKALTIDFVSHLVFPLLPDLTSCLNEEVLKREEDDDDEDFISRG